MILRIILYVLAAVSIWYSFMIYSVHSGSSFFAVWALIGVFLVKRTGRIFLFSCRFFFIIDDLVNSLRPTP